MKTVTIERQEYPDNKGSIIHAPDYVEYTVKVNGELVWQCKTSPRKWCNTPTPVRKFEEWLVDEQTKSCCNISGNSRNCIRPVGHGMKPIVGLDIDFDFGKLVKVSDLIYFDGPLLSHYISEKGDNYLYYWVDVDDTYNRWLIIRTDIFSIQQYLDKKIPLYSIVSDPNDGFVYTVDIDSDAVHHNIKIVKINDLPESYLPSLESYYVFELNDDIDLAAISRKYSSGSRRSFCRFFSNGNNN